MDPGESDLDRAMRELRIEHRLEQEDLEEAVELAERAGRTLSEVALEFLYRGDSIRVRVGERTWNGLVVHVGTGVMTLRTQAGAEVDVDYKGLTSMRVIERARLGGRPRVSRHPGELVARLRELANTEEKVELGGRRLEAVAGIVQVVARSHVEFTTSDGGAWILPLGEIDYLIRSSEASP
ncbi:MAG: hypothetical protein M3450_01145 [Actinomycetota bacterium]|nr:hypothetical protein [Actinomycetota bacterium]MDQ3640088.1 hypothetical protein [Actinomycetota bacterium]